MSFETEAELSLTVPRSELRAAREEIEGELSNVDLDLSGSSMSAQSARSDGGRGGRGGRSMRLAESRNEYLDDMTLYLESIDDILSEGGLLGGGGGGFGGIITELAGAGAETAGDVAIEAGDQVAEAIQDTLVGTASTALGTAVSDAISSSEVAVADTTVPVTPNPLPVEGGGGREPTVSPVNDLSVKPGIDRLREFEFPDLPDLEFGPPGDVRIDESQLPLAVDRDPLQVENVGPISVEDVGPITLSLNAPGNPPRSSRNPGFFERAGNDLDGITGDGSGPFGPVGRGIDTVNPFTSGGYGTGNGGSGGGSRSAVIESNNDIDVRPRFTINIDSDRLVDRVERLVENAQDEVRKELTDKIESVESDIDDLERQVTGRR